MSGFLHVISESQPGNPFTLGIRSPRDSNKPGALTHVYISFHSMKIYDGYESFVFGSERCPYLSIHMNRSCREA